MNLRRKSLAVLVALCLILAQHAAVLHELTHLSGLTTGVRSAGVSAGQDAPLQAAELCLECLAFSAVVVAASGAPASLLFSFGSTVLAANARHARWSSQFFHSLARGPPPLL